MPGTPPRSANAFGRTVSIGWLCPLIHFHQLFVAFLSLLTPIYITCTIFLFHCHLVEPINLLNDIFEVCFIFDFLIIIGSIGKFSIRLWRQYVILFPSIAPIVCLLLTFDRKSFRWLPKCQLMSCGIRKNTVASGNPLCRRRGIDSPMGKYIFILGSLSHLAGKSNRKKPILFCKMFVPSSQSSFSSLLMYGKLLLNSLYFQTVSYIHSYSEECQSLFSCSTKMKIILFDTKRQT